MTTITIAVDVWATDSRSRADIFAGKVAPTISIPGASGDMSEYGWSLIGPGVLTFERPEDAKSTADELAFLRSKQSKADAEAAREHDLIEGQIQSLLAIGNEAAA
jgi:hypothetical protein